MPTTTLNGDFPPRYALIFAVLAILVASESRADLPHDDPSDQSPAASYFGDYERLEAAPLRESRQANRRAEVGAADERMRRPPVALAEKVDGQAITGRERAAAERSEAVSGGSAAETDAQRPLPITRSAASSDPGAMPSAIDPNSSLVTVGGSLAVVLGLFFMLAWLVRRNLPAGVQAAPGEVLEVLGRAPLPGKQQLQVVRFGSKLVLLSLTAEGVEAVSEITDPDEVQQLTAACRRQMPGSSAHTFQEILTQMGREPAKGFLDEPAARPQLSRR